MSFCSLIKSRPDLRKHLFLYFLFVCQPLCAEKVGNPFLKFLQENRLSQKVKVEKLCTRRLDAEMSNKITAAPHIYQIISECLKLQFTSLDKKQKFFELSAKFYATLLVNTESETLDAAESLLKLNREDQLLFFSQFYDILKKKQTEITKKWKSSSLQSRFAGFAIKVSKHFKNILYLNQAKNWALLAEELDPPRFNSFSQIDKYFLADFCIISGDASCVSRILKDLTASQKSVSESENMTSDEIAFLIVKARLLTLVNHLTEAESIYKIIEVKLQKLANGDGIAAWAKVEKTVFLIKTKNWSGATKTLEDAEALYRGNGPKTFIQAKKIEILRNTGKIGLAQELLDKTLINQEENLNFDLLDLYWQQVLLSLQAKNVSQFDSFKKKIINLSDGSTFFDNTKTLLYELENTFKKDSAKVQLTDESKQKFNRFLSMFSFTAEIELYFAK